MTSNEPKRNYVRLNFRKMFTSDACQLQDICYKFQSDVKTIKNDKKKAML